MADVLPEQLLNYFATREAQRADAVNAVLSALTDRELRLVKEAAVMGYVQGAMHLKGERIPKDSQILATVIDACLAHADLYPAVNAVTQPTEEVTS